MNTLELHTAKILLIDDQKGNIQLLESLLRRSGYSSIVGLTDPRQVLPDWIEWQPDLIILDLHMPYLDGFTLLELITKQIPIDGYVPILVLTADATLETKRRALSLGAKDFLCKPIDAIETTLRVKNLLETRFLHRSIQEHNLLLEVLVRRRTRELEELQQKRLQELNRAQTELLERLGQAAEFRDDETGQHTKRVGIIAAMLAEDLGLPRPQVDLIRRAAPLHDLGKIGIPDAILRKPGKLTPEEFTLIKTHTTIGAMLLDRGQSELVHWAYVIALTHHERWDGSGYPRVLAGEAIPLPGRIVAVADAFDVITHTRPYKAAQPVKAALEDIRSQRGRQFDPTIVDALLRLQDKHDILETVALNIECGNQLESPDIAKTEWFLEHST